MLSAVKDALTKEVKVKKILNKEVNVKEFLEMEVELTKLKELLATEIKLKEFLVKEIDLGSFMSGKTTSKMKQNVIEIPQEKAKSVPAKKKVEPVTLKRDLPAYDYTLIDTLHNDHKDIRFIFNQIMSFAIEKDYTKVAGQLEFFNTRIRAHYQKADTELYSYLKTYIQIKYPKREKAFTQLSLEMKNLSIEIYYVLTQSPNIPLTEDTYNGFIKEFMAMGKLLNERILREESVLFKMYQQTNVAKSIS